MGSVQVCNFLGGDGILFPQGLGILIQVQNPITLLCLLPLIWAALLTFTPNKFYTSIRVVVMCGSILTCFWSQYRLICTPYIVGSCNTYVYPWLFLGSPTQLRISFAVGIDGISLVFILLTTLIFPFCFLSIYKKESNLKFYCLCLLTLESFLLFAFSVSDLFFFYIFFEAVLIARNNQQFSFTN